MHATTLKVKSFIDGHIPGHIPGKFWLHLRVLPNALPSQDHVRKAAAHGQSLHRQAPRQSAAVGSVCE